VTIADAVTVAIEPARQAQVVALLEEGDRFTLALYPAESCYLLNLDELERPGVSVFVARRNGVAVGMAALVDRGDGSAELKRMFVSETARGRGIARSILSAVEGYATASGIRVIQLETGPLQVAAIAMYERTGYLRIPNFGQYMGDEFSVCFEKRL
jgi:putative acetyltransferase